MLLCPGCLFLFTRTESPLPVRIQPSRYQMPPKKTQAKAIAAAPSPPAGSDTLPPVPADIQKSNAEYYQLVQEAINTITAKWPGIETQHYGGRDGNRGHQAPYQKDEYMRSMKDHGLFVCGFNMLAINPLFSACPGVRINLTAVKEVSRVKFALPCKYDSMIGTPHQINCCL